MRTVLARQFPISIDTAAVRGAGAAGPRSRSAPAQIREDLGNPTTIMLGVDRLDYTKGIGHRLKAFGELLAEGTLAVEDVTLVQVASPSRERVETYTAAARRDRAHGRPDQRRLRHDRPHGHQLPAPRVSRARRWSALYLAADVMLVTALRDGMNLVAKEYVAGPRRRRRRARAERVRRRVRRAARRRC